MMSNSKWAVFTGAIASGFAIAFSTSAESGGCARASSLSEKSLCGSAGLHAVDQEMATAYSSLRNKLDNTSLKSRLLLGQRAWISERERRCQGSAECLMEMTQHRKAALDALAATGDNTGDPVESLEAVWFAGRWKVDRIDPTGHWGTLPDKGASVLLKAGAMCIVGDACLDTGVTKLANLGEALDTKPAWAEMITHVIGAPLAKSAPAYFLQSKARNITVVPYSADKLIALATDCSPNHAGCVEIVETWIPLGANSRIYEESLFAAPIAR